LSEREFLNVLGKKLMMSADKPLPSDDAAVYKHVVSRWEL